ncbi:MAG: hypothetical protein AAF441_28960 [Pseudomonadota bacterium]
MLKLSAASGDHERENMITFAVRLLAPPPGWRTFSGKLFVPIEERLLENARRFCFGAAAALEADLPIGLTVGDTPPCASGKIHQKLIGQWQPSMHTCLLSAPVGGAPEELEAVLTTFGRDRIRLQLLFIDCPEIRDAEPEICFQALVRD